VAASEAKSRAEHLDDDRSDRLAFYRVSAEIWRQIWSNTPRKG
jgi:hypothetical protein